MSKSLKGSVQGSKAASGSAVRSVCAASQAVSDSAHHTSAVVKSWMGDEKNSYLIQMKKKLKSHPDYKNSGKNELDSMARSLVLEEELFSYFSHLIHDEQGGVILEGTRFQNMDYSTLNTEEREAAKEREQERFDRIAKLTLTVCLCDIGEGEASIHKDKTVISIANFLSMEYSGKHASIIVDNVLLEWNTGNIVVPRTVSNDDTFTFEGDVHGSGDYFNRIADLRPRIDERVKPFEEEGEILCHTLARKEEHIRKIIAVVAQYNSAFYYNMVSRNCQDFVKAVLQAVNVKGKVFSPENEDYLQLSREGKMRVPQVFKSHEDIDSFVIKTDSKNGLKSLNETELSWLVKAYETHHGEEPCTEPTCQFDAVTANLVSRQNS